MIMINKNKKTEREDQAFHKRADGVTLAMPCKCGLRKQ